MKHLTKMRRETNAMSLAGYPNSQHDRPHARIYDHHMMHPAWYGLSGNEFLLITRLLAMHRPANPNSFGAGGATISKLIGVSEKTAVKLVDGLIAKGHLREERRGRNRGMIKTRERVVSLTRYDTDAAEGDYELPIKVWRQSQTSEKLPNEPCKKSGSGKNRNLIKPKSGGVNIIPIKNRSTRI